jgi:hypothetical protein
MTNIRLRIEDAIPAVVLGSMGDSFATHAGSAAARSVVTPVAYRMAPVTPTRVEFI